MNFGVISTRDCVNTAPPPDSRCSDPAFAIANPDICSVQPKLVLKPGTGIVCQLGSLKFKAFIVKNGVEQDVSSSATYSSSNLGVALISAVNGECTGIQPGETTISATYQGMTATAKLSVLSGDNCCGVQTVAMLVIVDTTYSMAQSFPGYVTKLAYAEAAARRFISEVNGAKDLVGLSVLHGTNYSILADLTHNVATVTAAVNLIQQTSDKTEFYDGIQAAITQLNTVIADRKVIVLISDGLDTLTSSFTQANDPILLLQDFKDQGGTVICFGVRASGEGFALLSAMATGGFFINAYPDVATDSLNFLSGLKGYICAGNCTPTGDIIVGTGKLNYTGFINWNVVGGYVDLQGNGFFDYLPGHGLYVDLISGAQPSGNENGLLKSKNTFALNAGDTYRLSVRIAGNQIKSRPDDAVQLRVYYLDNGNNQQVLLDHVVPVPDFTQPFQLYSFSFTSQVSCNAYITVQQVNAPPPSLTDLTYRAGVLLDLVQLDDVTNLSTLLSDNFDAENPTFIPPKCGQSSIYASVYGTYCSGYGCLDEPPPVQQPDPNPLGDVESGAAPPPTTFTSTQQACASCPVGSVNLTWDLVPSAATTSNGVPITPRQNMSPPWCSNTFPAWVQFAFTSPTIVSAYLLYQAYGSHPADANAQPINVKLQGSNDGLSWTDLDTRTGIQPLPTLSFPVQTPAAYSYYRVYFTQYGDNNSICLTNILLNGQSPAQECSTATATSQISQGDADTKAYDAALTAAQLLLSCQQVYTSTQQYTATCPVGTLGSPVTKSATVTSYNSQAEADAQALAQATAAAIAALNCQGSNNNQGITINDNAQATPYPSVKFVSGLTGLITKVVVNIKGFAHTWPTDVLMVLEGPDGTTVVLQAGAGDHNAVSGLNYNFRDDAPGAIPQNLALTSTDYQCAAYGIYPDLHSFAPPGPAKPYAAALSAFNGKNPNGSWALWVVDYASGNAGQIVNGFDLVITSL